jgi:Flp pilus assembly protein TadG
MRSLNDQPVVERDKGAVLIWVALTMAVLLGIGALVIDIGRLYVERRELQNGADAAALAVAQDCSAGNCGDAAGTAKVYADLNANDAASAIEPDTPCGDGPGLTLCTPAPSGIDPLAAGWVRVGTSTLTSTGDDEVSFLLAPIISALTGKTVTASAAAAWGTLGAATTLPFTFSECEFNNLGELNGLNEFGVPNGVTYVYSKSGGGQNAEPLPGCESRAPSGGTVEGGFGWLTVSGGTCSVQLSVGDTITGPGDPGNDNLLRKSPCSESLVQNKEVLIPLFGSVTGTGQNAVYTIVGFAGFIVTGYRLSGSTWPSGFSCPQVPGGTGGTGNLRCFRGEFTQIYDSQGDFGGSIDFGARVVKMVE